MKHLILLTLIFLLPLQAWSADNQCLISGKIVNARTQEPLEFISIAIKNTTLGASTNSKGEFEIKNVPSGKYVIEASAIGYNPEVQEITITDNIGRMRVDFSMEESNTNLNVVVVSANRNETLRKMAPNIVNVINVKTFETTNSCNLSQGLNFQPGVRVETNCQNCGFQQVRINGLDGPYTQILVDSRPIFSSLAGVYGLEQIPANMIDRVEVMKGGGSALFGSSAIAGTINIITKEPTRNTAQASHLSTVVGKSGKIDNVESFNAGIISDDNRLGLSFFGQTSNRNAYDHNGDGFSEMPMLKNQTLGFRGYFKTGIYSKITAEYHKIHEFRRGGDNVYRPAHEADIAEQLNHDINTAALKYDKFSPDGKHRFSAFASMQNIDRDSYYGSDKNLNAYGRTTNLSWVSGMQYNLKIDRLLFMPSVFTSGIEFSQDRLNDNMWGYQRVLNQNINILSAYGQNEWKTNKLSFLLGGRLDKHSLIKQLIFSPRANLRYNPTENINLRMNYSFGFRAPQAFDEDLHIENVGGTVSFITLDENLKVEKSQSFGLSADTYGNFGDFQTNFLADAFYTKIYDIFANVETGTENGVLHYKKVNEKGADVFGINLEGKVSYRKIVDFQGGMTLQRSLYAEARKWSEEGNIQATRKMFRTPDYYGYFTLNIMPMDNLNLDFSGTYTGSMLLEHRAGYISENRTERSKPFYELNTKISYSFKFFENAKIELNAGIHNIFNSYQKDFDLGKNRDSAYIYGPASPRSIFAGIKVNLL